MATLVTGRMVEDQSITLNDLTQSSGALMFRNKIINGNFDNWQRGTSFSVTANETYTADRWVTSYNGTGATRTISRQTFALGQTDVPNEPAYFLKWNQSIAGSNGTYNALVQRIESVRTLANKQITISFYAKAAAAMNIGVYAKQIFGTGESPSAAVYTNIIQATLSNTWQKYTVTFTVPSIAGKTLGSNNNNFLEITFSLPLNTTFTFDVAQVQVEEGSVATPFEQRPIGTELQLCQRYYQVLEKIIVSGYGPAAGFVWASGTWLTPLRIDPGSSNMTVTSTGVSNTYGGSYNNSSANTWTVQNQIVSTGIGWGFVTIIANAEL